MQKTQTLKKPTSKKRLLSEAVKAFIAPLNIKEEVDLIQKLRK